MNLNWIDWAIIPRKGSVGENDIFPPDGGECGMTNNLPRLHGVNWAGIERLWKPSVRGKKELRTAGPSVLGFQLFRPPARGLAVETLTVEITLHTNVTTLALAGHNSLWHDCSGERHA